MKEEKDFIDNYIKLEQAMDNIRLGVSGKKYDSSWIRPKCLTDEERKKDYMRGMCILSEIMEWVESNIPGLELQTEKVINRVKYIRKNK